jgi:hypothetical protein
MEWMSRNGFVWFLDCVARVIDRANELTAGILAKETFWRNLGRNQSKSASGKKNSVAREIRGKIDNGKVGKACQGLA